MSPTINFIFSCSGSDCNKLDCIFGEKSSLLDTNEIYSVESINERPKLCLCYSLGVIANIGVVVGAVGVVMVVVVVVVFAIQVVMVRWWCGWWWWQYGWWLW